MIDFLGLLKHLPLLIGITGAAAAVGILCEIGKICITKKMLRKD